MTDTNLISTLCNLFRPSEGSAPNEPTVTVDASGVYRRHPDGDEHVTWEDLRMVEIVTTDEGPFCEDFFWVLHGSEGGVVVPAAQAEEIGLLEHLQQLPGFDSLAVIEACGSTSHARFPCWERHPA
jgi:hypothetical protein